MNEETGITVGVCVAILAVAVVIMAGCHEVELTKREAIKAGLEQGATPGSYSPVWKKP